MRTALTIAGSDSGGGAGVQADLKTFHQFGVFGTSVVVAVTAQNTTGVSAVHSVPVKVVEAQMAAVATDLPPRAVKTGMLATTAVVAAVAHGIREHGFPNVVVDPVTVASSGDPLLHPDAIRTVIDRLVPLARLITPNLAEAELLTGLSVRDADDMEEAGRRLVELGAAAALVKGGHLEGRELIDVLICGGNATRFVNPRFHTTSTHGTGCTLSAAVAAALARGVDLPTAVRGALNFVHRAIEAAPNLGHGHGPLNHFVPAPDM